MARADGRRPLYLADVMTYLTTVYTAGRVGHEQYNNQKPTNENPPNDRPRPA